MKIANEPVEREVASREGRVLITAKKVYKITRPERAYDVWDQYKEAERCRIPVPSTAKFTAPLEENRTTVNVHGIVMDKVYGRFFQLAKGGGEAALIGEIRKMKDKSQLEKVLAGLKAAAASGLGDPQGFINPDNLFNPLYFIDIHIRRGGGGGIAFQSAIETAEKMLAEME